MTKGIVIICILALQCTLLSAQTTEKDRIHLKTGKTIKCTIGVLDSLQMTLHYSILGQSSVIPLSQVASYEWDDVINAKYPVNKPSTPSIYNNDAIQSTDFRTPGKMC